MEVGRIMTPEDWSPSEKQILEIEATPKESGWEDWKDFNWLRARTEWESAFSGCGVIENQRGEKYLELRRAMTEVDGYVCCVNSKRTILQTLVRELAPRQPRERRQHRSYMFIASPGFGKTILVRNLAKALKLRFLPFNITQLLSRNDLLDCFETIVTIQAQNRDEVLLVFFDEVNAKLDGQHVYDAFLGPLEEGQYVRGGKTFYIDPCVWIFAGTERPAQPPNGNRGDRGWDRAEKGSDFISRLTREPFGLKIDLDDREEVDQAQLEKVYLGVSLIRSAFPDVRKVSDKVLKGFQILPVHLAAREIQRFVKSFRDIQYGVVLARNLPEDWPELFLLTAEESNRLEHAVSTWQTLEESEVEIRG